MNFGADLVAPLEFQTKIREHFTITEKFGHWPKDLKGPISCLLTVD